MLGPDLRADLVIPEGASRRRRGEPSMKATARNTERLAKPCHRPDPPVFRDEGELHLESFAK